MQLKEKIQRLKPFDTLLKGNLMGLEKEGLRVSRKGGISQVPHPYALGCALTHPNITTDFSESLLELVTPPLSGAVEMLSFLENTQYYLYHHLPKDQNFWPTSMPCVIRGETTIPIAQYGTSNQGKLKTIYRQGLANRYGSVMQTIAGIHFNYSFSNKFWQQYKRLFAPTEVLRSFIDNGYMGLIRNIVRYGWIIPYLFGASPAVCKSFLKGYHTHSLVEFNDSTLYEPYATSLRMGNIGYQNLAEDEAGVKANYNSLSHYINSLKVGMQTSCSEYEMIGVKRHGKYQQLNTNILQIENEYYASVRPKPLLESNKNSLNTLSNSGIGYVELRSIDINPLLSLGIDKPQIHFLEAFMLFCLLEPSCAISTSEQFGIDTNDQLVAHEGRKPKLMLMYKGKQISRQEWGSDIITKMEWCTALLSENHQVSVRDIACRINNPDLTPSAITLSQMKRRNQGFFDYTNSLSKKYRGDFLFNKINKKHFDYLDHQAKVSCQKQLQIEASDLVDFDTFLNEYFIKYLKN
ncbi:glutamate--cysteine ligase [Candidatus Vesicomyidisocius calyptogenae]|uniref:Glutamate--cysteine ligase n=1 Tax=Vesicomyosocius okutanii subsp. Calyptogena okutanii (strain HA) TaxID=412965 RepID=A5CVJ4_VESOH|nr:glutamate--cysteine ligase [Candidatus Vesicomyosocius okutanii]BAF62016.1 glutamate--cysteine ligase [Candidatus Vesicomyosocius okutanii]